MSAVAEKTEITGQTLIIDVPQQSGILPADAAEWERVRAIIAEATKGFDLEVAIDEMHPMGILHAWEISPLALLRAKTHYLVFDEEWYCPFGEGYGSGEIERILNGTRYVAVGDYSGMNEAQAWAVAAWRQAGKRFDAMKSEAHRILQVWTWQRLAPISGGSTRKIAYLSCECNRDSHESLVYWALRQGYHVPDAVLVHYPRVRSAAFNYSGLSGGVSYDRIPWRLTPYPSDEAERWKVKGFIADLAATIEKSTALKAEAIERMLKLTPRGAAWRRWESDLSRAEKDQRAAERNIVYWKEYQSMIEAEDAEAKRREAIRMAGIHGKATERIAADAPSPLLIEVPPVCDRCGEVLPDLLSRPAIKGECSHGEISTPKMK